MVELEIIAAVWKLISPLSYDEQKRVLSWCANKSSAEADHKSWEIYKGSFGIGIPLPSERLTNEASEKPYR